MRNTKKTTISLGAVCTAALLTSGLAQAHHSFAMFDTTQCRTITGTIRTFELVYPHSWIWIDVLQDDGSSAPWGFEAPSPTQLKHIDSRWSNTVAAKGAKVTVKFAPLRDGRNGGEMGQMVLPDGHALTGSPGLCDPRPGAATPTAASSR
jgi:Family of unknown function (DUF6152)